MFRIISVIIAFSISQSQVVSAESSSAIIPERPNILFIMSDDHTSQAIGAYGGRLAPLNPTPNLDLLAREGILFTNVFCVNSICTPSRASILTGQHSQHNGVYDLYDSLEVNRQYLPREIARAGYTTAVFGKWHLKESPEKFDYYCVLPGQGRYMNPVFYTKEGGELTSVRFDSTLTRDVNLIKTRGHSSDVITDLTLDWLENNRPEDQPFFCMLQYKAPHGPFESHPRFAKYLEDVEIPEPDNLYDQPGPRFGSIATRGENDELVKVIGASVSRRHRASIGKSMDVDPALPEDEYTHLAYQRYLKKYLRCIKGVDENLSRIFEYLEDTGLMDNTVIIYTGDQGMFLGEHDFYDKRWMYEEAMRMPLLIRLPDGLLAGTLNNWLINNTDFAPTFLQLAGLDTPDYMQGRSFADALRGEAKPADWRIATYYRYWMHMGHSLDNPAHFGIRTDRYKLIFFYGADFTDIHGGKQIKNKGGNRYHHNTPVAWEFYDLEKDPHEMHNQYANPQYVSIIVDLKQELRNLREQLGETDEDFPHIQKIIEAHWDD